MDNASNRVVLLLRAPAQAADLGLGCWPAGKELGAAYSAFHGEAPLESAGI